MKPGKANSRRNLQGSCQIKVDFNFVFFIEQQMLNVENSENRAHVTKITPRLLDSFQARTNSRDSGNNTIDFLRGYFTILRGISYLACHSYAKDLVLLSSWRRYHIVIWIISKLAYFHLIGKQSCVNRCEMVILQRSVFVQLCGNNNLVVVFRRDLFLFNFVWFDSFHLGT